VRAGDSSRFDNDLLVNSWWRACTGARYEMCLLGLEWLLHCKGGGWGGGVGGGGGGGGMVVVGVKGKKNDEDLTTESAQSCRLVCKN